MADITLPKLADLTGIFPGASWGAGATSIENDALSYKGINGDYWSPYAHGADKTIEDGTVLVAGGAGAGAFNFATEAAGGIEFVRAINETLVHWQADAATGSNALKYFSAKAGNFTIADQTALKRDYTTSLYYKLDNTIDSAGLTAS